MKNGTVLISGASIAGPALAFWLRRYGFTPTVVERAPALRGGGYKVDVRGAAVEVLRRMDLLDRVTSAGTAMRDIVFVSASGKPVASLPAKLFAAHEGDDVEIMRGDLAGLLYDATKDGTEYLFDDWITGLVEGPDGVQVTFTHAAPRTFDLVVGADGLHSGVRALAFGPERDFVRHLGYHISIFTVPNHLGLDRSERMYATAGHTTNLYSTRGADDAKALFIFPSPEQEPDHRDTDAQKRLLADWYGGQGWEVPRLLTSLPAASDFYFDSISQVQLDHWSTGRITLVGDAAYCPSPATGQGTSLALVGAYVLAGELAAASGDHGAAFAGYEREMREYVRQNQDLGPKLVRNMVARSRAQVWLSSRVMAVLPHLPGRNGIVSRIVKPIQAAANAITLKDYAPVGV